MTKELFSKAIGPLALAAFVLLLALMPGAAIASQKLLGMSRFWATFFVAGIPFGMKKMCTFLVPVGHEPAASVAILLLYFVVGGIIGMFVLSWSVIGALIDLMKSGITLIQIVRLPG